MDTEGTEARGGKDAGDADDMGSWTGVDGLAGWSGQSSRRVRGAVHNTVRAFSITCFLYLAL